MILSQIGLGLVKGFTAMRYPPSVSVTHSLRHGVLLAINSDACSVFHSYVCVCIYMFMCSCAVFRARVPSHQEALPAARSATPRLSPASSPSDTRYLPDDFSIAVKTATRRSLLPFDFAVVRHVTCSNTLADNVHLGPQMPLLGGSVAQVQIRTFLY